MRLLIDNNLPPGLVDALSEWDVVHVRQLGLQAATDQVIFDLAASEHRIVVSQDADFGTLLARLGGKAPSVVLIRRPDLPTSALLAPLLRLELPRFQEGLDQGAVLILESSATSIRNVRQRQLGMCI
jgi:predicted nuclease of predicted toxin-antitoxin system